MAAAAAVLIMVVFPWGDWWEPVDEKDLFKGEFSFEVFAKRGPRQFKVEPGQRLTENDSLKFVVTTGGPAWIYVISIPAVGTSADFYPDTPSTSDPRPLLLPVSGRHELPGSIILDNSTGPEYLMMLHSGGQFDRADALNALEKLGPTGIEDMILGDVKVEALAIQKVSAN